MRHLTCFLTAAAFFSCALGRFITETEIKNIFHKYDNEIHDLHEKQLENEVSVFIFCRVYLN